MTLDATLIEQYRRIKAEHLKHGQHTPARHLLSAARHALTAKAEADRFARIGAVCYLDDPSSSLYDSDDAERSYLEDFNNQFPRVRLLIVPDYDGASPLDFDCCGPDGRPVVPCDCEIDRSTNSHVTPRARLYKRKGADYRVSEADAFTGRSCRYGQPCKHKCDEAQRIDQDGVSGIVAQVRTALGQWITVDSCWGFVGDDWRGDYEQDAIGAALDYLDSGQADGC